MLTDKQALDLSNHFSTDIDISKTQIRSVSGSGGGGREKKSVIVPFGKECKSFLEKFLVYAAKYFLHQWHDIEIIPHVRFPSANYP